MSSARDVVVRLAAPAVAIVAVVSATFVPPGAASAGAPTPTVVTAVVSANDVRVGTAVTVSGMVTPPGPDPRTVVLQLATATGWRPMGHARAGVGGDYEMAVPTDWYGPHVLRVVATSTATAAAGVSGDQTVSVAPSYTPRGRATQFSLFDTHARWDPCQTIGYRTNLRLAPPGSRKLVERAFKIVHAATGLRFQRLGATRKVPFSTGPDATQHLAYGLVVAWSTPRRVPELAGSAAGFGGATAQRTGDSPWRYVYGGVVLDARQKLPVRGFGNGASVGALLLHELGHTMGLNHVRATSQIMYPALQTTFRGRYEAGDLAGLHAVGAEQGCFT